MTRLATDRWKLSGLRGGLVASQASHNDTSRKRGLAGPRGGTSEGQVNELANRGAA